MKSLTPGLDLTPLRQQLEASGSDHIGCKAVLKSGSEAIHQRFTAGAPASSLLADRSALIDLTLQHLWTFGGSAFDGLSLVAVGGYGRTELLPHSDIDLCVLVPDELSGPSEQRLGEWITSLWDLGLDIGHSVRTLADVEREASADITVITNMMEARLIAGDSELFEQMKETIAPKRMWPAAAFFEAKQNEQRVRNQKFQTNAYRLEPNVKESRGGLRDAQMISWVSQRQFGTRNLRDLVTHGILDEAEFDVLWQGLESLWTVRYLMHHIAGRREDRLLFDLQLEIAELLGYKGDTPNAKIEQLMQPFYRTIMSMQRLNDIILQGIGGTISGVTARSPIVPINRRFQLRNGFIEVTHPGVFDEYPPALLEVFLVFGKTPNARNFRADTVRLIRSHLHLIDEKFRADPHVRMLFLQIFVSPEKLTRKIRLMNRYGVLAAYLPAFDAIVGRMQYDLFHLYTVDEHTTRVIRNVRRFALPQHADEFPHCSEVMQRVKRPELLYIAALFHDIAKGRDGDHSVLGAVDALEFCRQHGLAERDAQQVRWLVRHHLDMSMTAQRKDIADPEVQHEFARLIERRDRLDMLYLLTVSDIRATNSELWNSYKASLLRSLYHYTAALLESGVPNESELDERMAERKQQVLELLADSGLPRGEIESLWEELGEDYFRQFAAADIARQSEAILRYGSRDTTLVTLRYSQNRGSTEVLVFTPDDVALFAQITQVLESLQLDIHAALVHTTASGHALDTFHVLEQDGEPIENPDRVDQIRSQLSDALNRGRDVGKISEQRPSRIQRAFSIPTEVTFHFHEHTGLTELHLITSDRPGILSAIARNLLRAGVSVHGAKIATLGERVEDTFFVRRADGRPLDDQVELEALRAQLIERL